MAAQAHPAHVVALDVGGTKVAGALVDEDGRVLTTTRTATPPIGGSPLTRRVVEVARDLAARGDAPVVGVGVSVAGVVEPDAGEVAFAPNLPGWQGLPLGRILSDALGVPAVLAYDGHAGAVGEHWRGAGRGTRDMAFLIAGTGVGGGLVLDGELYRGSRGIAGAAGWMVVDSGDARTAEARRLGALESVVAGPALVAAARRGGLTDAGTAVDVARAADAGSPVAQAVVERAARALAHAVVGIVSLLDLDVVVLGGGLGVGVGAFTARAREAVATLAQPVSRESVRVVPAALADEAFLVGVARLVFERVRG